MNQIVRGHEYTIPEHLGLVEWRGSNSGGGEIIQARGSRALSHIEVVRIPDNQM